MVDEVEENESTKPFGVSLSEARESLGLSLAELSKTLNLDIDLLEALENSDVDKLPPAIYVQGYIKAYTKALNISSEAIHAEYLKSVNKEKTIELKPRSPLPVEANSGTPIVKTFSVLLAVLALAAFLYGVYNYYSNKVDTAESISDESGSEEKINIPMQRETLVITQDAQLGSDDELIVNQPAESSVIEEVVTDEVVAGESVEEVVISQEEPGVALADGADLLRIKATDESWAEVRDDNKNRIYFGMLQVDDFLILKGNAPFDIFLGNAVNVSISVNDVEVDMSDYIRINNIAHFKVSEQSNHIVFH